MAIAAEKQAPGFSTAAEKAYRTLREKILTGEFAQGEKLSQRKMAALAGVSIIPVIEALVRLEHDGLVEYKPQWGARVPLLTEEKVRDLFAFREAIECQVARLLAGSLTTHQKQRLQELADQLAPRQILELHDDMAELAQHEDAPVGN